MCCSQCGQENLNSLISLMVWVVDSIDSYSIRSFYPITNSGRNPIQNNTEETREGTMARADDDGFNPPTPQTNTAIPPRPPVRCRPCSQSLRATSRDTAGAD